MDTIVEIIRSVTEWIALYALLITLALIIIINSNNKRKKRYIDWKKQSFNIWVLKIEWERNDDLLLNELFSENDKLSKENSLLKQDLTKLSIRFLILYIIIYLNYIFKVAFKKDKNHTVDSGKLKKSIADYVDSTN